MVTYPALKAVLAGLFLPVLASVLDASLVSEGPLGLNYGFYANKGQTNAVNTVPDFSKAGYRGGGVGIPFIPATITVPNEPGDDTERIQGAIDALSAMEVGPDGFRGAVVLEGGEFTVAEPLKISHSGIVIRGAGSQEAGGTRITYTATERSNLFNVSGPGGGPSERSGTRARITDAFVPVGATSFMVEDSEGFAPGDSVMIENTMNQAWIDAIGNMEQYGWRPRGYQLKFRRTITEVSGNRITIEAPIVQTIEDQYGGGALYQYDYPSEIENVGFESLRLESTFVSRTDEQHGWTAIRLSGLKNGWVRQCTVRHFGMGAVSIGGNSQQITVEDSAMLDHKSTLSGGRRYSFGIDDSQNILFQRLLTRDGRHDFVSGSRTPGPNVWVDCRADQTRADIGPHARYATGQIYDNVMGGAINVQNRRGSGSGHGWAGAQILFWNCKADSMICNAPIGAMNWSIGSTFDKRRGRPEELGIWESEQVPVRPRSLYYAQLEERLGTNAVNSVRLPLQERGRIWEALHNWGGDGLFLDPLLVQVDADSAAAVGRGYPIRGVVRDLPMLDRGATFSWRSVYGPAPVSFDDETALETRATFSAEGRYLLELSADDGQAVAKNVAVVVVGSAGDLQPPEQPQALTATADESAIHLDWADNAEADLAGYMIYRSTAEDEPTVALEYGLRSSEYTDRSVEKGIRYVYTVWAVDTNSNFSPVSDKAGAMVNAPPELRFVESLDGQSLNEGWDLELSVEASDKGGSVDSVELFLNGESVGRRDAEPYAWSYSEAGASLLGNLELGSYTLEAVATDDEAVSTSKVISFEVIVDATPPSAPTGLTAVANDGWVRLDWSANTEIDWASTRIYRSEELGVPGILLAEQRERRFVDTDVVNGTRYFYSLAATDTSGLVSPRTLPVEAMPEAAPPGMTIFGKLNAGLGGFIPSHGDEDQMWTPRIGSVRYRNQNRRNQTATFLKAFALDRSVGSSYRLEGVVTLTGGYAHDNNRIGLYLFGDEAGVSGRERGALAVPFNLEGGTIAIVDGINGKTLASESTGRRTDSRFFGTDLNFSVTFTFKEGGDGNQKIDVVATLTDSLGQSTTTRATVDAASYTGDWFGFASRTRSRNYGIEGAYENAPWVVDYHYFWLTDDYPPVVSPSGSK